MTLNDADTRAAAEMIAEWEPGHFMDMENAQAVAKRMLALEYALEELTNEIAMALPGGLDLRLRNAGFDHVAENLASMAFRGTAMNLLPSPKITALESALRVDREKLARLVEHFTSCQDCGDCLIECDPPMQAEIAAWTAAKAPREECPHGNARDLCTDEDCYRAERARPK